jgi:hypothetical protein
MTRRPESDFKVCTKCKRKKEVVAFTKSANLRSGYLAKCKLCVKAAYKNNPITGTHKVCTGCKTKKKINCFSKAPRYVQGVRSWCKECERKNNRDALRKSTVRVEKNKQVSRDRWKRTRSDPETSQALSAMVKKARLLRMYGVSPSEFSAMLKKQNGVCAICKNPELVKQSGGDLSVDHCHETGKVRGLLCRRCNTGLGMFGDHEINLLEAANYVRRANDEC